MNSRKFKEIIAQKIMFSMCIFLLSLALLMVIGLFVKARPILAAKSLSSLIFSNIWRPTQGQFGLGNFILGTLCVTGIAMFFAVPLGLLTAIYIAEYAPKRVRDFAKPLIDLLAGISPVIYGVWGIIAIVPLVRDYIMPFFSERFPFFPFASDNYTGYSAVTAGIILAIMVTPVIISIIDEVLKTVPFQMKESSLALGATKWQTVKYVLLKKARPGIIAAIILALSRAFGETIAVLMVAGCSLQEYPKSIFDTAYPMPAFIANTYGEMMSIPLYDSAVLLVAFILLILTAIFNMIGWGILLRIENE